jgi:hypothetical protein
MVAVGVFVARCTVKPAWNIVVVRFVKSTATVKLDPLPVVDVIVVSHAPPSIAGDPT